MRIVISIAASLCATLALVAEAQAPAAPQGAVAVATEPGAAIAVATVEVTATVAALDKATRGITLELSDGTKAAVTAGPEVQNFDQIEVGDTVMARYLETLELRLLKGQQAEVRRTETLAGGRAEPGQRPAGAVGLEVHAIGNVTALDAATQTITVEGPQRTVELTLQDPEQFKLVEVGDQIEATYTQALAVQVQKAEPAKK
jgi:hypothetical protein